MKPIDCVWIILAIITMVCGGICGHIWVGIVGIVILAADLAWIGLGLFAQNLTNQTTALKDEQSKLQKN